ncbi:hypothetical protein D3C79_763590 [compost metagenome]
MTLDVFGTDRINQLNAKHQTTATNITQLWKILLQTAQVPAQALAHGLGVSAQVMVFDVLHHRRTCSHGHLVAAERPGMGARLPGIEPLTIDHHRQRQAATDGFGHHHHVRDDTGMLKRKHFARTGKATLDFIDDQGHTGLFGNTPHTTQPFQISWNHPTLSLHRLDDHRRR